MDRFAVPEKNVRLIIIGLVIIIVGYVLMAGGGSDDPAVFNPEIFSPLRITVAPLLIIAGFVLEIYAVLHRPSKKNRRWII